MAHLMPRSLCLSKSRNTHSVCEGGKGTTSVCHRLLVGVVRSCCTFAQSRWLKGRVWVDDGDRTHIRTKQTTKSDDADNWVSRGIITGAERTSQVIHDRATMVREVHLVLPCCSAQAWRVCSVVEERSSSALNLHNIILTNCYFQFNEMFAVIGPIPVLCHPFARRRYRVKQHV